MYAPSMQIARTMNPLLQRYLRKSAFEISDTRLRHLHQIEGYMRYRSGQISYEEMNERGTFLASLPLLTMMPSGTAIELDDENKTTYHDKKPIVDEQYRNKYSFLGFKERMYDGRSGIVIRVDNRMAIKRDATYMWTLAPSHKVKDICDDYHGRIYRGSDVPPPLHIGCNCQLREISSTTDTRLLYTLQQINEHHVWGNVTKFVDEVDRLNTSQEDFATTVAVTGALLSNPTEFLIDQASTKIVGDVKELVTRFAQQQIQSTILSQIRDEQTRSIAEMYLQGTLKAEMFERLKTMNPQIASSLDYINRARTIADGFNSVDSVSGAIDFLQSATDELGHMGVNVQRIQRITNSPILHATKAKAVMLEGGVKGLTRLAMILI